MPQLSCKKKKCENWSLTPHEYVQNKEKHFLEGSSRDCLNDIKYSCPACQFSKSTLLSFVLQGEEFGLGHSCYCQLSSAQRLTAKCEPQVWRERELRQFRTILVLLIDLLWPSVRTMPEVNILYQNILKLEEWGLDLFDTQIDSIQCLNFAQNWFNSIFKSKLFHENSIQKIIQFKVVSWKFNSKDSKLFHVSKNY